MTIESMKMEPFDSVPSPGCEIRVSCHPSRNLFHTFRYNILRSFPLVMGLNDEKRNLITKGFTHVFQQISKYHSSLNVTHSSMNSLMQKKLPLFVVIPIHGLQYNSTNLILQ